MKPALPWQIMSLVMVLAPSEEGNFAPTPSSRGGVIKVGGRRGPKRPRVAPYTPAYFENHGHHRLALRSSVSIHLFFLSYTVQQYH